MNGDANLFPSQDHIPHANSRQAESFRGNGLGSFAVYFQARHGACNRTTKLNSKLTVSRAILPLRIHGGGRPLVVLDLAKRDCTSTGSQGASTSMAKS